MTIARPRVEDCGECVPGIPDVPEDVPITPTPEDECETGSEDISTTIDPDIITPPPDCWMNLILVKFNWKSGDGKVFVIWLIKLVFMQQK